MIEYKVIVAGEVSRVIELVRLSLENGWVPQGGISSYRQHDNFRHGCFNFMQAMTLETTSPPDKTDEKGDGAEPPEYDNEICIKYLQELVDKQAKFIRTLSDRISISDLNRVGHKHD